MSVQSFMWEFRQKTTLYETYPRTRCWRGVILLTLDPHLRSVGLGRIEALKPGNASEALEWLNELADRHGVKMQGVVEAFGAMRLKNRALANWYKRHGWEVTHSVNGYYIDREPKSYRAQLASDIRATLSLGQERRSL